VLLFIFLFFEIKKRKKERRMQLMLHASIRGADSFDLEPLKPAGT